MRNEGSRFSKVKSKEGVKLFGDFMLSDPNLLMRR
jgi:hypothetical protein